MILTLQNRQRARRVDGRRLRRLAQRAASVIGVKQSELSIVLVSDRQMARLNRAFHQVAGPTDILTFDYGASGELIISVDHAHANARRFGTAPREELTLYLIHGLLHLAGYDDRTAAERRRMRAAERRVLRRLRAS